jgi:ankyrin repeat protein
MKAVCENDLVELKRLLKNGWQHSIDDPVDHEGKWSALSLACYLDHLEAVHLLDLHGADLSCGIGKYNNTALMAAVTKWNVRIIDYLMERGVDPFTKDKYGFTAKRKAELKQLRTITSMLEKYEKGYKKQSGIPVTNELWAKTLSKDTDLSSYRTVKLTPRNNEISTFKPSQLYVPGEYPFSNF